MVMSPVSIKAWVRTHSEFADGAFTVSAPALETYVDGLCTTTLCTSVDCIADCLVKLNLLDRYLIEFTN